MLDLIGEANAAALIGLLGGIALGLAARIGRFCTLGAIEDFLYSSDDRRLRMWGIAIGVAILGTHAATAFGHMNPAETVYLDRVWSPLATVLGGLLFGYGMALSGNCGYGALARLGGGDLRAFLMVIVMGLSAAIFLSGPLAQARVWLFPVEMGAATAQGVGPQGIGPWIEAQFGWNALLAGGLIGAALLILSLATADMRRSRRHILWGTVVGLAIASGWIGTYWIAQTGFGDEPLESHSFAAPIADTIFYTMTASGNALSFSVGSVLGVVLGAALGAMFKGQFRWEACDDPRELKRQILGAALMGPGAVLAVGCSVGQGLTAFSVLAFSAPLAFGAIFLGTALGLKQLISGLAPAE